MSHASFTLEKVLFQKPPKIDNPQHTEDYPISLWHFQEPHASKPSKKMCIQIKSVKAFT